MMYKKNIFFSVFIFLFLVILQQKAPGQSRLSDYFIDPQKSPLVIYGQTFPGSVIYQNNTMYAPAEDFLSIMGIKGDLSQLPDRLFLNGMEAPPGLIAFGPHRYTGQDIYYINVTGLLDLGKTIEYTFADYGGQIRITVSKKATPQPVDPASLTGSISGIVDVGGNFLKEGSVTLQIIKLESPGPQGAFNNSCTLDYYGGFSFAHIPPGEYKVEATCRYTWDGPVEYDYYNTKDYYYQTWTYNHMWTQNITISAGQNLSLNFSTQDGTITNQFVTKVYVPDPPVSPTDPGVPGTTPGTFNSRPDR